MNTLQYSLHKGPGDTVDLDDAPTREGKKLSIAGMFDGSVFQGVLVMAESRFLELYPDRGRLPVFPRRNSRVANVEEAHTMAQAMSALLESQLSAIMAWMRNRSPIAWPISWPCRTPTCRPSRRWEPGAAIGSVWRDAPSCCGMCLNGAAKSPCCGQSAGRTTHRVSPSSVENLLLVGWGLVTGIGSALLAMAPHPVEHRRPVLPGGDWPGCRSACSPPGD